MKRKFTLIILIGILILFSREISAQNSSTKICIEISDVRSSKGTLRLGVFINEKEFEDETPLLKMDISKAGMVNGKLTSYINLPKGKYGISILDDENNNTKMDYNFIGIPKEGFGFSNYYHSGFSKPKLSLFVFNVDNTELKLKFKLRYM